MIERVTESAVVEGRLGHVDPEEHESPGLGRQQLYPRSRRKPLTLDDCDSVSDHMNLTGFHAANHLFDARGLNVVDAVELGLAGPMLAECCDVAVHVLLKAREFEWSAADHTAVAGRIPL